MVAKAELRTLKNATLLDGLFTSGLAALEGAGVLPLAEVGPAHNEGLVIPLPTLEDFDDTFVAGAGHESAEGKVDGGGIGFSIDVQVDGVELLVAVSELLVEDVPDKRRLVVVFVKALLELAVSAGMGKITKHWSVGECVRAAGAGEHGRGTTQCQGPREQCQQGRMPRKSNMQAEMYNGAPMCTVLKTGGHTSLRAEIYRPVAVYLRLLALLIATYLGTAQCHCCAMSHGNLT
jgi:hypothetical protein